MSESKVNIGVKKLPIHLQSSQNRLHIKGGTIVNDDRMFKADIYIEDGVIRQIGTQLTTPGGVRTIDASGKMIIPGGVDANTNFQNFQKGLTSSDDFYSGTKAALAGGTTTIIDFVTPRKDMSLIEAYDKCREIADTKVCCDYALHVSLPHFNPKISQEMETLVKEKGVNSFKISMADDETPMMEDGEIYDALLQCRHLGALALVHAENGSLVKILESKIFNSNVTGPEGHLYSHPEDAEIEATSRAVTLAGLTGCPVYILKMMSSSAAHLLAHARHNGKIVMGETIVAALATDGRQYMHNNWLHAASHVTSPPLRSDASTPEQLMRYVASGVLETVNSSHCVFKSDQRAVGKDDFRKIPEGVNGVEDRLSVIWEKGVMSGILDPCKFVAVTSTNAAKIFNLYPRKGRIDIGSDADIVIWDAEITRTISAKTHNQNTDFNVFEGIQCHGVPLTVITCGRIVLEDGNLRVTQGAGRFLTTSSHSPYLYERIKRSDGARVIKPMHRDPYLGPVSKEFGEMAIDKEDKNGNRKLSVGPDGDAVRCRSPTRGGGRNMQESSFSLSGAQYDDNRPVRTAIRTKQPPGGASNALW